MTDFNNHNKQYTAKDFERYYAGMMTAMEMHELEKSALDDPILQDALDGYQLTKQGVTEIEALKKRLNERIAKGKVVSLSRNETTTSFWKVAAMVLLTAGMGWLIYRLALDNESKDIALTELPLKNLPVANDGSTDSLQGYVEKDAAADINTTTAYPTPGNENAVTNQEASKRRNEKITPPQGRSPLPGIEIQPGQQGETASANVALPKSDTSAIVGYGTQSRQQGDGSSREMQKAGTKMEDAVVGESEGSIDYRQQVTFEEVIPKNGEADYMQYVARNFKTPLNNDIKGAGGSVMLSFDVDPKGQAVNIKVERSLCKSCDAEAVRLLKEGPGWIQQKNGKRGKFSIRF